MNALASAAPAVVARLGRPYHPVGSYRFILAMFVTVAHFGQNIAPPDIRDALFPLSLGTVGVSCFFVLSGLIIVDAVLTFYKERPFRFLVNRLLRVIPPLVFSMVVAFAAIGLLQTASSLRLFNAQWMGAGPPPAIGSKDLFASILSILPLPQSIVPRAEFDLIPVLWTLKIELFFYCLIFLVSLAATMVYRRWSLDYVQGMGIGLQLAAVAVMFGMAGWAFGLLPAAFSFLPYFSLGVALFYALRGYWIGIAAVGVFSILAVLQYVFLQIPGRAKFQLNQNLIAQVDPFAPTVILIVSITALIAVAAAALRQFGQLDRTLGDLTYSLYLNHTTVGVIVLSLLGRGMQQFWLAIIASILLSVVANACVEPTMGKIRNKVRGADIA